jgi:hypothetical protein
MLNAVFDRLNVETSVLFRRFDGNDCPREVIEAQANTGQRFPRILRVLSTCLVDLCPGACTPLEVAAYESHLSARSYFIYRTGFNNVRESASVGFEVTFPRFTAVLGETFLLNAVTNEFTFFSR